jgi:hypothetical protein
VSTLPQAAPSNLTPRLGNLTISDSVENIQLESPSFLPKIKNLNYPPQNRISTIMGKAENPSLKTSRTLPYGRPAPSTTMTQTQATATNGAGLQQPEPFHMTFGGHVNKTLLEMEDEDPALMAWMLGKEVEHQKLKDDEDEQDETDEKQRQDEEPAMHQEHSARSFRRKWRPPHLTSAPAKFRDKFWRDKSITKFDAGKFFHVEEALLSKLKTASLRKRFGEDVNSNPSNPSYCLFHVWALVKAHNSEKVADEALREYEVESSRRRVAEEMAMWAR